MRARTAVSNLLLAAVSVLVMLALLEGAARLERRFRGGGKEDNALAQYTEADPVLGWRKRPGGVGHYRRREYSTEVVINSDGLRDEPRAEHAAPGTFRVLLLGDSFVEGYSVRLEDTVGQALQASLRRDGCPVEVINGGTTGYSTDQEYLFYLEQGQRYSPDVVVLFFYYNDILFNDTARYFSRDKPLLRVVDGKLEPVNVPLRVPHAGKARNAVAPVAAAEPEPVGSAAFEWLRDRLMRGAPSTYDRLAGLGLWPRFEPEPPHRQMFVYRRREPPAIKAAWSITSRILETLAHAVKAHGSRFLVAYVPNRMEVVDRDWDLSQHAYGMTDDEWDRNAVRDRLAKMSPRRGFRFLDLGPALRQAEHGMLGSTYFTYDGHWNARGHRAAAGAVAEHLAARHWLPDCAGPRP